ncbi:MAG: hypothetical protein CL792_02495 [Chloroflexi bacterium]|nr:hypothetical protein [Chloroflexota bacterium]|tara:strand:+ start:1811 stop:2326 length:516 start_codon:yes stop_codon:yes gene_type:complete
MIRIDHKNSNTAQNSTFWKHSQENEKTYFVKESANLSMLMKKIFITMMLFALPLIGMAQVLQTNQLAQNGLALNRLVQEHNVLKADVRILEASIASNVKLREIHQEATTRLGMIPAEKTMHISIDQKQAAPIQVPLRFTSESNDKLLPQKKWWDSVLDFTFNFFVKDEESN